MQKHKGCNMSSPILITPQDFDYSPKLPSFGHKISSSESLIPDNTISQSNAIFFIGGLADSYTKALFYYFLQFSHQDFCKFYGTYDCTSYLPPILEQIQDKKIYFISHSWGACNTIKLLSSFNQSITYLLTLDDVSYTKPKPLPNVKYWENVYISNHWNFNTSNITALLGHPQKAIKFANLNTKLNPPYTHTSIGGMLRHSKLYEDLGLII